MNSDLSGFYKKNIKERFSIMEKHCGLSKKEINLLKECRPMDFNTANALVENTIGVFGLPLGIATNFRINNKDYLVPMAIEESSVIAAASKAAKIARKTGGFKAECKKQLMIGQIQVMVKREKQAIAIKKINSSKKKLLEKANACDKTLVSFGGGVKKIEIKKFNDFIVLHLIVDVRDAMGANAVNTMCEALAKEIEKMGFKTGLKVLSNLALYRIAIAKAVFSKKEIGEKGVKGVLNAYKFAAKDSFRAVTHNKGAMNGVDAVTIATGNDFRAMESGIHAYASLKGKYSPITKYSKNKNGDLVGEIEIPVQVGVVGGSTKVNPMAKLCLKILGVKSAEELACIIASVGLAQNFAALYALSTEGIQKGHMKLHAENIAIQAGANQKNSKKIALKLIECREINEEKARELIKKVKK